MLKNISWEEARDQLLARVHPVSTENVSLYACAGRILAFPLVAQEDVPAFDRSAYDGYALKSADVAEASPASPVTLSITETVPAGTVPSLPVCHGTAAHVMTGAGIPEGADCVINFERTSFTDTTVTLACSLRPGDNVVRRGEDVCAGTVLAACGTRADPGIAGTLASQGITAVSVYRRPVIGLVSTGSEIVEAEEIPSPGAIRNANRATFTALLSREGCDVVYLGHTGDDVNAIAACIRKGLASCDAVLLTGGVSVGDWDVTPEAMENAGVDILLRGVSMKPGMACCYGFSGDHPVLGLSGNPASALTNFCACVLPAIRRLCGQKDPLPQPLTARLLRRFPKKSPATRFLRGRLTLNGEVGFDAAPDQGNIVLSSAIGCNAFLMIPAGSGPVDAGEQLKGFMI